MNKLSLFILLLTFAFMLQACSSSNIDETKKTNVTKQKKIAGCEEIKKTNDNGMREAREKYSYPYTLDSISIKSDTLNVMVKYSGGCNDHCFNIFWQGMVMDSYPVQVGLELLHNGNGDMCDGYLIKTLTFDLNTLKKDLNLKSGESAVLKIGSKSITYTAR